MFEDADYVEDENRAKLIMQGVNILTDVVKREPGFKKRIVEDYSTYSDREITYAEIMGCAMRDPGDTLADVGITKKINSSKKRLRLRKEDDIEIFDNSALENINRCKKEYNAIDNHFKDAKTAMDLFRLRIKHSIRYVSDEFLTDCYADKMLITKGVAAKGSNSDATARNEAAVSAQLGMPQSVAKLTRLYTTNMYGTFNAKDISNMPHLLSCFFEEGGENVKRTMIVEGK